MRVEVPQRLALDTRNWLPKEGEPIATTLERVTEDFASASIEQRVAPPEERINTGVLYLHQDGHLYDALGEKIKLRWETESDYLENHAFGIIENWAKEMPSKNLAWISPPSNETGYTETRVMVYETQDINGQTTLLYRAFCLPYSQEDCMNLAQKLRSTCDENIAEINSTDQLRAYPVFFNPPEGSAWFDYLEELIKEPNIWQKVKGGDDLKARDEIRRLAQPVVEKYYHLILAAERAYDYVAVGAMMERELAAAGIIFQARGSCGASNQEALKSLNSGEKGVFDTLFASAALESSVDSFDCPSCHGAIPSGLGITTCPHCGAKKEDYGTCI